MVNMVYLCHYGIPKRSGRYPYGSGERPYQNRSNALARKGIETKKDLTKRLLNREITTQQASTKKSDGKETRLKKGEKVQHVSGVDFKKVREGQLYVTANKYDNALYETFLGLRLKDKKFDPKKVELTLSENLNAPSSKKQFEVFQTMIKENEKQIRSDLKDWLSWKNKDKNVVDNIKSDKELYDMFMNSIEKSSKSQSIFYTELKKNGYNAVLDEHDITGSWMQATKPLIIMNALNTVRDIEITDLSIDDLRIALDEYLEINSR